MNGGIVGVPSFFFFFGGGGGGGGEIEVGNGSVYRVGKFVIYRQDGLCGLRKINEKADCIYF